MTPAQPVQVGNNIGIPVVPHGQDFIDSQLLGHPLLKAHFLDGHLKGHSLEDHSLEKWLLGQDLREHRASVGAVMQQAVPNCLGTRQQSLGEALQPIPNAFCTLSQDCASEQQPLLQPWSGQPKLQAELTAVGKALQSCKICWGC